jgi:hypothetical protein
LYLFAAGERLNSKKLLQLSEFTAAVNWANQAAVKCRGIIVVLRHIRSRCDRSPVVQLTETRGITTMPPE